MCAIRVSLTRPAHDMPVARCNIHLHPKVWPRRVRSTEKRTTSLRAHVPAGHRAVVGPKCLLSTANVNTSSERMNKYEVNPALEPTSDVGV